VFRLRRIRCQEATGDKVQKKDDRIQLADCFLSSVICLLTPETGHLNTEAIILTTLVTFLWDATLKAISKLLPYHYEVGTCQHRTHGTLPETSSAFDRAQATCNRLHHQIEMES